MARPGGLADADQRRVAVSAQQMAAHFSSKNEIYRYDIGIIRTLAL